MNLLLSFSMNALMTVLLAMTVAYCWKLNRRIRQLQDSKGEMAQIIREFSDATLKAQASISELKGNAKAVAEVIQHKIDKAGYLADDLSFMIEKGDKIANQLEDGLTSGRRAERMATVAERIEQREIATEAPPPPPRRAPESAPRRVEPTPRPQAAAPTPAPAPAPAQAKSTPPRPASLESVLEKIATRNAAKSEPAAPSSDGGQRPIARLRTQAERELLDALKQVR